MRHGGGGLPAADVLATLLMDAKQDLDRVRLGSKICTSFEAYISTWKMYINTTCKNFATVRCPAAAATFPEACRAKRAT